MIDYNKIHYWLSIYEGALLGHTEVLPKVHSSQTRGLPTDFLPSLDLQICANLGIHSQERHIQAGTGLTIYGLASGASGLWNELPVSFCLMPQEILLYRKGLHPFHRGLSLWTPISGKCFLQIDRLLGEKTALKGQGRGICESCSHFLCRYTTDGDMGRKFSTIFSKMTHSHCFILVFNMSDFQRMALKSE